MPFFSYSKDKCLAEKRKTVNGDDLLYGLNMLGFSSYEEPLKIYLDKYRDTVKGEKPEKEGKKYVKKEKKEKHLKVYKQRSVDVESNDAIQNEENGQQVQHHYQIDHDAMHSIGTTYQTYAGPILAPLPLIDEYGKQSSILQTPQVKESMDAFPSSSSCSSSNSAVAYDALISRSLSNSVSPYSLEAQLSKLCNYKQTSASSLTPSASLEQQQQPQSTDMVRASSVDSCASSTTTNESNSSSSFLDCIQSEYVSEMMLGILHANNGFDKNNSDKSWKLGHNKDPLSAPSSVSNGSVDSNKNGSLNSHQNIPDNEIHCNSSYKESPTTYSFIGYEIFEQTILGTNKRSKLEVA